jgi:hypothetical protein
MERRRNFMRPCFFDAAVQLQKLSALRDAGRADADFGRD